MARQHKIISDSRKSLEEDKLFTNKDNLLLHLLQNTYSQYIEVLKEVKNSGVTMDQVDYNKNVKRVISPSFKAQLELQKEIFKYADALYLSPKSRKTNSKEHTEDDNPFSDMMKDINKK